MPKVEEERDSDIDSVEELPLGDEDEYDEDEDDMDFNADLIDALSSLLTTEQGDNVCTAMVKIAKQLETQNKIMMKMLSTMQQQQQQQQAPKK